MTPVVEPPTLEPEIIESVLRVKDDDVPRRRLPTGPLLAGVLVVLALVGWLAGGLSAPGASRTAASPSPSAPASPSASAGASPSASRAVVAEDVYVSVAGATCTLLGPTRVVAGSAVTFHLTGAALFTVDALPSGYPWHAVLQDLTPDTAASAPTSAAGESRCATVNGAADLTLRLAAGLYAVRYAVPYYDALHLATIIAAR